MHAITTDGHQSASIGVNGGSTTLVSRSTSSSRRPSAVVSDGHYAGVVGGGGSGSIANLSTTTRTRQRYAVGGGAGADFDTMSANVGNGVTTNGNKVNISNDGSSGDVAINIQDAATNNASLGTGQIVDPNGYGSGRARWDTGTGNGSSTLPTSQPMATRSHYHLSRTEILKGVANRFVHSTAYIYFYGAMALASLMTVLISLVQDCPGTLFYSLELAINAILIAEVGVRGYAFGKQFWKSTFNIIDLGLVALCAVTLIVLFFSHDCSPYRRGQDPRPTPGEDIPGSSQGQRDGRGEELLDSLLLILRNAAQLVRLLSVVRRSRSNVTTRVANIDLDDARHYSLDWDLEEEGLAARQRMADGGDRGARQASAAAAAGGGTARGDRAYDEHRQLFDYDEDDEEL